MEGQQGVVSRWKADILGDSFFRFLEIFDDFFSNTTTNHNRSWIFCKAFWAFRAKVCARCFEHVILVPPCSEIFGGMCFDSDVKPHFADMRLQCIYYMFN